MAELLVRAKPHWKDAWDEKKVTSLNEEELRSYKARSQVGDIICVRPDGWKWGKEECLPTFIVVKVPEMTDAEAKKYESSLTEKVTVVGKDGKEIEIEKLVRYRKHAMPKADIESAKASSLETISLSKTSTVSKVIEKTGAVSEIEPPVIEVK